MREGEELVDIVEGLRPPPKCGFLFGGWLITVSHYRSYYMH
jgi:hypothetical protein